MRPIAHDTKKRVRGTINAEDQTNAISETVGIAHTDAPIQSVDSRTTRDVQSPAGVELATMTFPESTVAQTAAQIGEYGQLHKAARMNNRIILLGRFNLRAIDTGNENFHGITKFTVDLFNIKHAWKS